MENSNLKMVINEFGEWELDYDFYFPEEVYKEMEEIENFQNDPEFQNEYNPKEEENFSKPKEWDFTKEEEEVIRKRIKKSLEPIYIP